MTYKKKMIWMGSFIGIIFLFVGVFLYLISAPYELQDNVERRIPVEKIATSILLGKEVSFSDDELESLIEKMLPSEWKRFSLRSDVDKEKFNLCISVPYKNRNFFVSVDISPEILEDNIILNLSNAHIGRLPVPVSFILKRMQDIKVNGNSIIIPNEWCFSIHGISTRVHVRNLKKMSGGNTKIGFQANISS